MYNKLFKSFFLMGVATLFMTGCSHRTETSTTTDSSVTQAQPLQTDPSAAPVYLGAASSGRAL